MQSLRCADSRRTTTHFIILQRSRSCSRCGSRCRRMKASCSLLLHSRTKISCPLIMAHRGSTLPMTTTTGSIIATLQMPFLNITTDDKLEASKWTFSMTATYGMLVSTGDFNSCQATPRNDTKSNTCETGNKPGNKPRINPGFNRE